MSPLSLAGAAVARRGMAATRTAERSMIERGLVVYAGGLKKDRCDDSEYDA